MPMPMPIAIAIANTIRACVSPRLGALLLCAILFAASPACAGGTTELPSTQNLDYQAGLEAIKVSDWDSAIYNLNVAATALPTDADLQNWLGYAYRQKGNYAAAFDSYRAALHLDPKHRGANEYIGEAYLLTGNKAKAREHLAALERICGKKCAEYQDLQRAIAMAK
jgi:tetratricopeptide (TPR) repeat protein